MLADERRVIALDLPGFGHSPMPREQLSISGYARLLDGLLEQLGVDAAAVVGNSMGASSRPSWRSRIPQRVERLVLVSAGWHLHLPPTRQAMRALPVVRRLERVLTATAAWAASKSDAFALRPRLREAALDVVVRHPESPARGARRRADKGRRQARLPAGAPGDHRIRVSERLPEIACPT